MNPFVPGAEVSDIRQQRKAGGPGVAWAVRGRLWSLREPRPPACRAEKEACSKGGLQGYARALCDMPVRGGTLLRAAEVPRQYAHTIPIAVKVR